jgi:hypothetical protein
MSLKDFRLLFLENMLNFLWRQWSTLGVLGESHPEDSWAIDPEPMLLFTFEIGRYQPRLFDEVLDWLVVNGWWIDLQRLRGILRGRDETLVKLTGTVAYFLTQKSDERKWQNLARFCKPEMWGNSDNAEILFFSKDGKRHPPSGEPDLSFLSCGFNRPEVKIRRLTREVPVTSQGTIRFLLRALFGVGSRAECLTYLLTHEGGHPAEIAKVIGLSVRGTQDALIDLSKSGLVLTRMKGKRKIEYWLSQERWWEFLTKGSIAEIKKPIWIDWIALYSALSKIWVVLNEMNKEGISDYMRSSKLRDSLEQVGNEFLKSGLDIPPIPGKDVKPNEYEKAFETFIIKVFGER